MRLFIDGDAFPNLLKPIILRAIEKQKIDTIVITHKDRFIRLGYEWFEKFLLKFDTKLLVVNNEFLSPQEENRGG